jgi:hypothetical protein
MGRLLAEEQELSEAQRMRLLGVASFEARQEAQALWRALRTCE